MSTYSDQTSGTGSSWSEAVESIFSYNGNVMLAAITSLLLVILFVLFLHLYAKWFLAQSRRSSLSVTHVLGLRHFDSDSDCPKSKGLDASVIAAIPLFVYCSEEHAKVHEECVVCLGGYEEGDVGRCLGTCGHAFHVECIDTWFQSHSSCPICRSPVVSGDHDEATASSNRSLEIVIDIIADQDRSDCESDGCDATAPSCSRSLKRMMSCKSKSEGKVHPRSEF